VKTYIERRSWWGVYRAFFRVYAFHMVLFTVLQAQVSRGCTRSRACRQPGSSRLRVLRVQCSGTHPSDATRLPALQAFAGWDWRVLSCGVVAHAWLKWAERLANTMMVRTRGGLRGSRG
jgi:hypothetical protein